MPRYIDAEFAEDIIWKRSEELRDSEPELSGALAAAIGFLDKCPTVDLVPAPVKCGECEKFRTSACHAGHEQGTADFCSHGVRKDGDKVLLSSLACTFDE